MLPNALSGSYRCYKEDTNTFISWLSHAAKACGYHPHGYKITTAELAYQVNLVASSASKFCIMPKSVKTALKRAIKARQRCGVWFAQAKVDEEADETHQHFVDLLKTALDLLQAAKMIYNSSQSATSGPLKDLDNHLSALKNKFAALTVDDIVGSPGDKHSANMPTSPIAQNTSEDSETPNQSYELEFDRYDDYCFAIFCFFEDLHAWQAISKDCWEEYLSHTCDIVTAMVVSHLAIIMVELAEATIIRRYSDQSRLNAARPEHPYHLLCAVRWSAQALREKHHFTSEQAAETYMSGQPLDEMTFEATAFYLFAMLRSKEIFYSRPLGRSIAEKKPYAIVFLPLDDHLSKRCTSLEIEKIHTIKEEHRFLNQITMDITAFQTTENNVMTKSPTKPKITPQSRDIFAQSFDKVWMTNTVSASAVFASRLLLDTATLQGSGTAAYADLLARGETASKLVFVMENGQLDAVFANFLDILKRLQLLVVRHIPAGAMAGFKKIFLKAKPKPFPHTLTFEEGRKLLPAGVIKDTDSADSDSGIDESDWDDLVNLASSVIQPAEDTEFLHRNNPFFTGTMAADLELVLEEFSLAFANADMSTHSIAHLYNALQQLNVVRVKWLELEKVMVIQRKALFAGQPPNSVDHISSVWRLRTGCGLGNSNFKDKGNWKFQKSQQSKDLEALFSGKEASESIVGRIREWAVNELKPTSHGQSKKTPAKAHEDFTSAELLLKLKKIMPSVLADSRTDYLTTTRKCRQLIQRIMQRLQKDHAWRPKPRITANPLGHKHLLLVHDILHQAQRFANMTKSEKKAQGMLTDAPPLLAAAGEEFKMFLNEMA